MSHRCNTRLAGTEKLNGCHQALTQDQKIIVDKRRAVGVDVGVPLSHR